jgi:hypothetical protein
VRASGRSRRHLRECAGCRDYRGALRSVEKTLNGLAPSAGPLSVLAKLLGLGGAGSGGGAVAFGGGAGAGATAGAGAVGTGAVATKVAAVVAAAAVVGGGAATVERVEHAVQRPAAVHRSHTVLKHPAPQASLPATRRTVAAAQHLTVPASVKHAARKTTAPAPTRATHLRAATGTAISSTGHSDAPALEPTSGGLEAPADDATTASAATPPADPGGSGTATAGTGSDATTGAGSTAAATTNPSATPATSSPTTSATSPSTASGPSGTVSPGAGGPVAQGAAAAPAG